MSVELPITTASLRNRFGNYIHLHFETPKHNRWVHYGSIPFAEVARFLSTTTLRGSVPEGPGLLIVNHISWRDPFIMHWAVAAIAGRTARFMARRTLIDPEMKESEVAIKRRTLETADNKKFEDLNIIEKFYRKNILAPYLKSFNPILTDIGGNNSESLDEVMNKVINELKEGRLVGIFVQGTRRPRYDLLDTLTGIAVLLTRYLPREGLDIPVIPVGISGSNGGFFRHIDINFGEAFRYSEIVNLKGQNRIAIAKDYAVGRIGELITDVRVKPAWELYRLGLTRGDIEEIYKRNPDLFSALVLARSCKDQTREGIKKELELIDQTAVFM